MHIHTHTHTYTHTYAHVYTLGFENSDQVDGWSMLFARLIYICISLRCVAPVHDSIYAPIYMYMFFYMRAHIHIYMAGRCCLWGCLQSENLVGAHLVDVDVAHGERGGDRGGKGGLKEGSKEGGRSEVWGWEGV